MKKLLLGSVFFMTVTSFAQSIEDYYAQFPDLLDYNGSYLLSSGDSECSQELNVMIVEDKFILIDDENTFSVSFPFDQLNDGYFQYTEGLANVKRRMDFLGSSLTYKERGIVESFPSFYSVTLKLDKDRKTLSYKTSGVGVTNVNCLFLKR